MSLSKDPLEVARERRRVIKAAVIQKGMAGGSPSAMPGPKSQYWTIASDRFRADHREAQFESPPSKPKKDWSRSCSPGTRSEKDLHTLNSTSNETSTKDPFVENSEFERIRFCSNSRMFGTTVGRSSRYWARWCQSDLDVSR